MKSLRVLIALAMVSFLYLSCLKDAVNPIKCTKEAADVSKAATDFSNNQTKANCQKYGEALLNYVDACSGAADRDDYQDLYDDLDCSQYN